MTKLTLDNWKKDLQYNFGQFAILGSTGRFYNGAFNPDIKIKQVESFIDQLLSLQHQRDTKPKDYIIVKTIEEAENLIQCQNPPKSLKEKYIIVSPNGLEFVSNDDIKQLPQVKELLKDQHQQDIEQFKNMESLKKEDDTNHTRFYRRCKCGEKISEYPRKVIVDSQNQKIDEILEELEKIPQSITEKLVAKDSKEFTDNIEKLKELK